MNDLGENFVTTYMCKDGREYVVKMRVTGMRTGSSKRTLDLIVKDKYTAEDWQSSYDTAYIENLTQKTGNYKQFEVFVAMLQSGLLKVIVEMTGKKIIGMGVLPWRVIHLDASGSFQTSDCITLDLLTFEDLELLRSRRIDSSPGYSVTGTKTGNRRYMIVTYSVEFDRIHYPLPLEYCGPPQPAVLQATIKKLEAELDKFRLASGRTGDFRRKLEQLAATNKKLLEENSRLSHGGKGMRRLLGAVKSLESIVAEERASFHACVQKLRAENAVLVAKLRHPDEFAHRKPRGPSPTLQNRRTTGRRCRSRSGSGCRRSKPVSLSAGSSSVNTFKSEASPHHGITRSRQVEARGSSKYSLDFGVQRTNPGIALSMPEITFGNLESRIHALQKMLKDGIDLN